MANQSKFEAMLEKLIAEDKAGAEELFHEIVVEKSRSIYEDLLETDTAEVEVDETAKDDAKEDEKVEEKEEAKDEDKVEEASKEDDAEDKVEEKADADKDEDVKEATDEDEKTDEATEEKDVEENFVDQITPEGDDDMGGDAADDMIADIEDGEGEEDKGDDEDLEDRVVDLEDALDDLKAEFDGMMSDKDGDEDKGEDDMEMDMDAGDDEGDEEKEDEAVDMIAPESDLEQPVAFENAEKPVQSSTELMREYVTKVSAKMGDNGDNTKSPVAGKNDMGGTTANIAKGGESTGGSAQAPKEDSAGNVNVPGGKASKSMSKDSKGHGAEKKGAGETGTDGKSIIGS